MLTEESTGTMWHQIPLLYLLGRKMPDPRFENSLRLVREKLVLEEELKQVRADAALVVHALDQSVILVGALIDWLPEGMVLPDGVKTAHYNYTEALKRVFPR